MTLVEHNPKHRRLWMFPRNIREIPPWKIAKICYLLQEQTNINQWVGNQQVQDAFSSALAEASLKSKSEDYSSNNGGARTYLAQLKLLGLVFQQKSENNNIKLTLAGEDLVNGKPPLPILQAQLLNHQYPCTYSNLRGVKINPQIKIKPITFLLKLMMDKELNNYLTEDEIIICVIYGHNTECYDLCKNKIKHLRSGSSLESLIDNPKEDLYTIRCKNPTFESRFNDLKDIANTCKNYMESCCLISTLVDNNIKKITINNSYSEIIENAIKNINTFIPFDSNEEAFQRPYGCWNRNKDTRKLKTKSKAKKINVGDSIIAGQFLQYCGEKPVLELPQEFIDHMINGFGFSKDQILKVITPLLNKSLSYYESTFVNLASGGQNTAEEFEKAVCKIFNDKLLFNSTWTGRKRRQKGSVGAYADILIEALDNQHCALIDTKASPYYNLGSADYQKMSSNYMKNYKELTEDKELALEFCLYVAGGFDKTSIENKISSFKSDNNIPVAAISAKCLLHITQETIKPEKQPWIRDVFKKEKLLHYSDFAHHG